MGAYSLYSPSKYYSVRWVTTPLHPALISVLLIDVCVDVWAKMKNCVDIFLDVSLLSLRVAKSMVAWSVHGKDCSPSFFLHVLMMSTVSRSMSTTSHCLQQTQPPLRASCSCQIYLL